jgi:hypothetical protein
LNVVEDGEWGNVRLDIRRAIVLQLERLGIAGEHNSTSTNEAHLPRIVVVNFPVFDADFSIGGKVWDRGDRIDGERESIHIFDTFNTPIFLESSNFYSNNLSYLQ